MAQHGRQQKEAPKERASLTVDSTWDIETESWDCFVAGSLFVPGGQTQTFGWRQEEAFVDLLLSLGKHTTWSFNGGRFDHLWLMRHVIKRRISDFKLSFSGSAIACMQIGDTLFRDAARVAGPMSLADFAKVGGGQAKEGTGLPCHCERACGGYCSIRRDMVPAQELRMRDYMVQDCRALYAVLDFLCTYCERNDLDLRPTIGASAWATAERSGIERASWEGGKLSPLSLYQKVRKSYYGGRTQVLKPLSARGTHVDIHSAYPAAFATCELPTGERSELHGTQASRAYASGKLGSFCAVVYVPERIFFPPLPVRTRFRSAYPVGRFGGWWTGMELQSAESRGATVERIDECVVWSARSLVLAAMGRRLWNLRDEESAQGNKALAKWIKGYINALSGKLSMRPESENIVGADGAKFCTARFSCKGYCDRYKCCVHKCARTCGATPPLGSTELGLFSRKAMHLAHCSHVEWAAHVTAHARIKLLSAAGDDSVYCDTDSMFFEGTRPSLDIGDGLGQFGVEDIYRDMVALAPKTYTYWDEATGQVKAASKGVPEAARNFDRLREGVTVERGVLSFKQAIRGGDPFTRKKLTRVLRGDGRHFGDRVLREDGRTYPQTVRQVDDDTMELMSDGS